MDRIHAPRRATSAPALDSAPDMNEALRRVRSIADPARIPPRAPRRLDPVSDAWARKYRTVARLNPGLSGDSLAVTTEKHFGGAA